MQHPVIVLIDNDDGAKDIFSLVKSKFKKDIGHLTKDAFYHLCHNLYLIKTPESAGTGWSSIEDCFESELLKAKVNEKIFNPSNASNPATDYGKVVFAEKVVVPNAKKIDFSKFVPLVNRIGAVIDDYKPPQ